VSISNCGKRASRRVGDKQAAEEVASQIRAKLRLAKFDLEEKRERPIPLLKNCAQAWIEITVPATSARNQLQAIIRRF
jgi:hypothetical protein